MEPTTGYQPGPYSWDEFIALDERDPRELIDGYLIEVEAPTRLHEYIVALLAGFVSAWARERKAGYVLGSGYKVQINQKRGVMPDLQFYRAGHVPADADQGLVGDRPELAVEVISPSSRSYDRVTKLNSYADIGVPEYWIVDPEARTLERLQLRDGRYVIEPHEASDVFEPDMFPGLTIPLSELWELPTARQ